MKHTKNDSFDYLIQLALTNCGAKDTSLFDEIDDSQVSIRPALDKRIRRLIRHTQPGTTVHRTTSRIKRRVGQMLVAALLVIALLFTIMLSVSAIREAIWRTVVEWYDDYIVIRFEPTNNEGQMPATTGDVGTESAEPAGSGSEIENLPPPKTEVISETDLGTVPEESTSIPPTSFGRQISLPSYVPSDLQANTYDSLNFVLTEYYRGEDLVCTFSQASVENQDNYFDNEGAIVQEITLQNGTATLMSYTETGMSFLVWTDGIYLYVFEIYQLDIDTVIQMANSLAVVES